MAYELLLFPRYSGYYTILNSIHSINIDLETELKLSKLSSVLLKSSPAVL